MEFLVVLTSGEDGYVVAQCPALPGCISQGRTRADALENIREAIELCLESREEEGWDPPAICDVAKVVIDRAGGGEPATGASR